jgi:hypothetical protein
MIKFTGQTLISHRIDDADLDLLVDWELTPGLPQALNRPAEAPEISIERALIDEGAAYAPLSDDKRERLGDDADFMARLMESAEADLRLRREEAAELQMEL